MKREPAFLALMLVTLFGCFPTFGQNSTPGFTNFSVAGNVVLPSDDTTNHKASTANLRDYEQHPENWRDDQLIGIARGYFVEANFLKAEKVYNRVLSKQPNNIVAIRGLGNCYWLTQDFNGAASQFKKGWALGDDQSLLSLANIFALSLKNYQDVKALIPDLLKLRERLTDSDDKHEIINILVVYSLNANPSTGKEVFLEAIKNVSDAFILERNDTAQLVILGLKTFGYQDRAEQLGSTMENRKKAEASFLDGVSKYHSGDHAGAITNYTESIRAYPEFALAYQNLGFIQNDLSQLRPALQNFYKSLELDPSLTYSRFYIWSIRGRLGEKEQAAKELIAYVRSLQGIKVNDWTAKIGDYLIGTSGDDDFLGAARASANNMEMMKGHLCQVCYYTGMKHLLGGDKNKAEILFENAVFVNKSNVPEYYSAEAELRNLNSTRQP